MNKIFIAYLFNHHCFVNQPGSETENTVETRISLAEMFNIRIISGAELLQPVMISQASEFLGIDVPEPFYLGFPESVRKLSKAALLFDQLLHYYTTYGLGYFDKAGHSIFEEDIERKVFNEEMPVRDFTVITEAEAVEKLKGYTADLLSGTRQLSDDQYALVLEFIREYHYTPANCASKNTAIRLLIDSRDPDYARFLMLSDVPKLTDELSYRTTGNKCPKKLNLKNQERKLLTAVIDRLIADEKIDTRNCYEKKDLWSGLLHHIHYKTSDPKGIEFLNAMRGSENHSALAEFEKALSEKGAAAAAEILVRRKGSGMLMRNLDYLLSRCESDEEVRKVIGMIDTKNTIILLQLLFHYSLKQESMRTFKFIKHGKMRKHLETNSEAESRKTQLSNRDRKAAVNAVRDLITRNLKGRLGKIYIAPEMKNIALPIQEGASQGGFGTLAKGSCIPLPKGKKIRAFTYWEKVNDIDLSVIGLDKNLGQHEFSWRTMAGIKNEAIIFSGDQTSGYHGGSEYFDIDPEKFKTNFPDILYLIFCDNVYSSLNFSKLICRAGYMLRDINDSGKIFEPETVKSSYTIDCESRFAYLFGLNLITNEFIWLNIANDSQSRVAGTNKMGFLMQYFEMTKIMNVYDFFALMSTELTDDPKEAEIAVTDEDIETGENTEVIRSYDAERMIALLNGEKVSNSGE